MLRDRLKGAFVYSSAQGLGPFLIRSVVGGGLVQIAGMGLGFLVGIQLARGLGPQVYGQYGIAMAAVAILSIPGQFGLPRLVAREVAAALPAGDYDVIRGFVSRAHRFAWAVSGAIAIVTAICAAFYHAGAQGEIAHALLAGAVLIPLVTLTRVTGGALQGLHSIIFGQVPDAIVRPAVNSVLLYLLFLLVARPSAADAMATGAISAAASYFTVRRLLAIRLPHGQTRPPTGTLLEWVGNAVPLALTSGIRILEGQIGVLLLGFLATDVDAGYFRLAMSIAVLISVPVTLVNNSVLPVFAKLYAAGDHAKLQRVVTHAARAQFAGVFLVSAPFFVAANPLIRLLFGTKFEPAANVLVLVATAQLISTAFGPNANLLNMTGYDRKMVTIVSISLLLNLVVGAALIPLLGLTGAAWSWVIATFVWNILAWQTARRRLRINTFVLAPGGRR